MNIDYDDTIRIRKLAHYYNENTKKANSAVQKWMGAEKMLDKALIINNVRSTSSWDKQVIQLVSDHPEHDDLHTDYRDGKMEEKIAVNTLKAIEMEMNALKKIYDETPK